MHGSPDYGPLRQHYDKETVALTARVAGAKDIMKKSILRENQREVTNDTQRMTSLEIAELAGKQHNDVLKAIRKMEPAWMKVTQGNFSLSTYKDTTGRTLPCYLLTKTECLYIATKFNDEARAKLVLRSKLWSFWSRSFWSKSILSCQNRHYNKYSIFIIVSK